MHSFIYFYRSYVKSTQGMILKLLNLNAELIYDDEYNDGNNHDHDDDALVSGSLFLSIS